MAAATVVSYTTSSTFGIAGTTKPTSSAVAWEAGDIIVALVTTEGSSYSITGVSATGLTFTERQKVTTADYSPVGIFTAVAGSAGSSVVTFTFGGGVSPAAGIGVLVVRDSAGVGVSNKATGTGGPSVSLAGVAADSVLAVISADWNAIDGASRTWRTSDAGSVSERTYFRDGSYYAAYIGSHANAGAAGTKVVGLSAPTGQKFAIAAVELLASGGASTTGALSVSFTLSATATSSVTSTVLFPSVTLGDTGFSSENEAGAGITMGFIMSSSVSGRTITGVRWWDPAGSRTVTGYLFDNDGAQLASSAATAVSAGWNTLTFTTPYVLAASELVIPAVYQASTRAYGYKAGSFTSAVSSSPFTIGASKGRFTYGTPAALDDATSNTSTAWFGVDAVITEGSPVTSGALAVTFTLSAAASSSVGSSTSGALSLTLTLAGSAVASERPPIHAGAVEAASIYVGADAADRIYMGGDPPVLIWARGVPLRITSGALAFSLTLSAVAVAEEIPTTGTVPGWLRSTSNTGLAGVGVTTGMLSAYSGSPSGGVLTITASQYRKRITLGTDQLRIGPGVELRECLIEGSRLAGQGQVYLNGAGISIVDSDLTTSVTSGSETIGIYGSSTNAFLLQRTKVLGFTIGMWLDGGASNAASTIEDCYVITHNGGGPAHKDGFTRRSGMAPLLVRRSRWDTSGGSVTGAYFIQPTWGGTVGNTRFEECYLEGAGYNATIETSTDVQFVNNRFRSTEYGPVSRSGSLTRLIWSGNYLYANNPGNEYKGALVP